MNSAAKTLALNDKFAPRRGGDAGVRTGPSRFGLKVRKCFVLVGGLHYCQLPNGPGRSSALSQDKELKKRVMQIVEIINPIFEFLRKMVATHFEF